jgi:hypothetical protein
MIVYVHLKLWLFQKSKDEPVAMPSIFEASKNLWFCFYVYFVQLKVRVHISFLLEFI